MNDTLDDSIPYIILPVPPSEIAAVARAVGHRSHEVIANWQAGAANGRLIMFAAYVKSATDSQSPRTAIGSVNVLLDGANEAAVTNQIGDAPMIQALGVNNDYRGRGIGAALLLACETYVRQQPKLTQQLVLGVEPVNAGARRLYERLGYRYHPINGKDLFTTAWPEFDRQGKRYIFSTQCLLMIKQLAVKKA